MMVWINKKVIMKILFFALVIILIDSLQADSDSNFLTEGDFIQKYLEKLTQSGYNRRIRPEPSSGPEKDKIFFVDIGIPINMTLEMCFEDIYRVDEINMEYMAQIDFHQSWQDSRLAFPDENNISFILLKDEKSIWTPDLFFVNAREGSRNNLITPNVYLRISKNGDVLLSLRLSLTLSCPMDFRKYPHDTQKCTSEIESYGYAKSVMDISWEENAINSKCINLLNFKVTDMSERIQHETLPTGTFTTLLLDVTFERRTGFFYQKLYVPFILLVAISWLSFWIPAKLMAPRLTLLLVVLYLMVNIGEEINSLVPKTTYTKGSDVWIAVCESLVYASILEFLAAHILARNKETREEDTFIKNDSEDPKIKSVSNGTSNNAVIVFANRLKKDLMLSYRLDKVSRILFPILFIFFNLVYWLVYCI